MKFKLGPFRLLSTAIVAILVVSSTGLGVVAQRNLASAKAIESRSGSRDAVVDVAREAAVAFTSYDYRSLGQTFSRVQAVATKDFAQRFAQASNQLKPLIRKKKASSTGRVLAVAVQDDPNRNSAAVLVAADATVRNTDVPQGAVQRFRLRLELKREGHEWLVQEITPVV